MLIILIQMIIMVMEYREIVLRKKILQFDETGSSLPDKDGILLNDWIDDAEADRLLHLYSKKKIDEI